MKIKNTQMQQNIKRLLLTCLVSIGIASLTASRTLAADDEVIDMIVELMTDSDSDMRMLALQQIREEVPGKEATIRFAKLLPTLPTEAQVKLIDALGDRGDPAARPMILKMLESKTEDTRAIAARALATLAEPADIPALAKLAATGSDPEAEAARFTLRKLHGKKMDTAMTAALEDADTKTKIELITALVDRDVKDVLSAAIKDADNSDLALRLAVLGAIREMGDENHTALAVKRLKTAEDKTEQRHVAIALIATCRRGQEKCADTVIAALDKTDTARQIYMMRALAAAGGPKALKEIVARQKNEDETIRLEAIRGLTSWSDPAAIPHLMTLARDVRNLRNHVLAIRGIARLAAPEKDRPADLAALSEAMNVAVRKEEKVMVLGTLGKSATMESLNLVASCLDQPAIAQDAAFAAVQIAEKITKGDKTKIHSVMKKVIQTTQNEKTKQRAKNILQPPKPEK